MKHPSPEACEVLGMTFLSIAEGVPGSGVDMKAFNWSACSTVACHAGWFGFAGGSKDTDGSFFHSSHSMNDFLKMPSSILDQYPAVAGWAGKNPKLWGNDRGFNMFSDMEAFNKSGQDDPLKRIGIHWLKVAARIREAQND